MFDITQEMIDSINSRIENLKIIKLIGKGGQKHVYQALYENQTVVLKIIHSDENSLERVKREVRACNILNSSHIPVIIKTNIDEITSPNELIWIVEEYIEGLSLRQEISEKRKFQLTEVINFFDVMLSILEKAESNRIVHRDIKPENIILDKLNKFWLIDFGISRHLDLQSITATNSPFGPCTVGYSASEQLRNCKREIDIRTDLFSLGVVAAEMILGYNPYIQNANDILQIIKNIEQQPLPRLKISGDTQFLLARFIKTLGDNRISRRPRNVTEAKVLFDVVKSTLIE